MTRKITDMYQSGRRAGVALWLRCRTADNEVPGLNPDGAR